MERDKATAAAADTSLVENRKEMMVSLFEDSEPILREAYFINPSSESQVSQNPPLLTTLHATEFKPKKWGIRVHKGWVYPCNEWKTWVSYMRPKFESVWEKAGIFEPIMCSTLNIEKNVNLMMGIAHKWCPQTNTIVFPWAEATITLEDVMVLGRYSLSGYRIPEKVTKPDLLEIQQKLKSAKGEKISTLAWLKKFIKSGSEVEHEAFLTYWIARFVFPISYRIMDYVFPIAIYLARGHHIALGPAVLASIYKDLTALKKAIVAKINDHDNGPEVKLCSPLCLLQMWAFERFPELRGRPNVINVGDPRAAMWHDVKMLKFENVMSVLDSGGETFRWRPYATANMNWQLPKFYRDKAEWVTLVSKTETETEISSYVFCIRPSDLVGINECIEQYSPHRVAMQFGIDQDIPGHIDQCNEDSKIAWRHYGREETKLYLPSRFFEADVTTRYLNWWKQSVSVQLHEDEIKDMIKGVVRRKRSLRQSKRAHWVPIRTVEEKNSNVPLVDPSNCDMAVLEGFTIEKKQKICSLADILGRRKENDHEGFTNQLQGPSNMECPGGAPNHDAVMDQMTKQSTKQKEATVADLDVSDTKHENITKLQDKVADNNSNAPPGFTRRYAGKMVKDFVAERSPTLGETSKVGNISVGEINNGKIPAHSDVFSKSIQEMVGETQASGKSGAAFGMLTTKTLIGSSKESAIGTSEECPGGAPNHDAVMDQMTKQSTKQKEATVADLDVSDTKHENITKLQDKVADNNSNAPPGFTRRYAGKMVKDFVVERSPTLGETSKVGNISVGEINNGKIPAHSDVFSKSIQEMVEETQASGKSGAAFGMLTTKTLVGSSKESAIGTSEAVGGNVVLPNKDESSPSVDEIIPGFELERKTSRLERIFVGLKKIHDDDLS